MKKIFFISFLFLITGLTAIAATVDTLTFGPFGKVTVYHPSKAPEAVVLFVSGDGGWNKGVVEWATRLADQGALVAGFDIQYYFKKLKTEKEKCYYVAGDFENLSMVLQKKYKLKQYLKPILVGYSSGATLVYGALAQAPANAFKGAISLGFCPDIEIDRPLCNGNGLTSYVLKEGKSYYLDATKKLTAPFIVLEGVIDQVCSYEDTKKYMANMPMGELITLPNVGHGFSIPKNSMPQFLASYQKILKEPAYVAKISTESTTVSTQVQTPFSTTLPLTIIPPATKSTLPLVFFISGDGGWSTFDHGVSEKLAKNGMPVLGLDSQKYFWDEKQPKATADEIALAVSHYLKLWDRSSFVLVGYSFGACVVPFIANNFSTATKGNLKGVFSLSPDETGDFEIHISDMLSFSTTDKYDVVKEMGLIATLNPVCIFGIDESATLRDRFSRIKDVKVETLVGGHHYDNSYSDVVNIILKDYLR